MGRSQNTVKTYLNDEKTHAAFFSKLLRKLNLVNDVLFQVELEKAEIEHEEPIIVGFSIFYYAKRSMLELYYNFFSKFSDVSNFEELEKDTKSRYLALPEK